MHPDRSDLSSLRILGSVGEPINPEAWMWYYKNIGGERCPIVDTFWQTETGGHMITPLPGATPLVPGSCTLPLPGIMAAIVDETGNDVPNGSGGMLVVKRPWPSMIRTIWNDPERFKKSYFPEEMGGTIYLAGDGAVRSADRGYFRITGRIDDVLNVSGHRMGTMEIESALVAQDRSGGRSRRGGPSRRPDRRGDRAPSWCSSARAPPATKAKAIAKELRDWVAKEIGPIAKPKDIRFGDNLPKTRSRQDHAPPAALAWPRARPSRRTPRRWRIRRSWSSWRRTCNAADAMAGRSDHGHKKARQLTGFFGAAHTGSVGVAELLLRQNPGRQFLGFGGVDLGLAGMGTGPQTPTPPFMILAASLSAASFWPAYLAATSL